MRNSKQMNAAAYIETDSKHVWHHLAQHKTFAAKPPMIVVEGKGLRIKDINGKEYLDATSGGVWCVNVGFGRDSIADAVCAQLKRMPYYAPGTGNEPTIRFSEKLTSLMPGLSRTYISNSGSEANEKAFKMVRAIGQLQHGGRKKKILYRDRDYHGTTLGTLSACGQSERKEWFGPFTPGFAEFPHALCYRCPFGESYPGCDINCAKALETVIRREDPDEVGAVIVEPITAGGGIIPPVPEYYPIMQAICRKYGVLLIMDEVVCGMGRTGKWFGYQNYDVEPDIVTMAKGVASAYMPISVTATREDVFKAFLNDPADPMAYFRDISTFGGCAGGCAAALENARIIEDEHLLENTQTMGKRLLDGLQELTSFACVGQARGVGLLAGIEIVADKATKAPAPEGFVVRIVSEIAALGVLVGRTNRSLAGFNNTINFAPALSATAQDIDDILAATRRALEKLSAQRRSMEEKTDDCRHSQRDQVGRASRGHDPGRGRGHAPAWPHGAGGEERGRGQRF